MPTMQAHIHEVLHRRPGHSRGQARVHVHCDGCRDGRRTNRSFQDGHRGWGAPLAFRSMDGLLVCLSAACLSAATSCLGVPSVCLAEADTAHSSIRGRFRSVFASLSAFSCQVQNVAEPLLDCDPPPLPRLNGAPHPKKCNPF
jgi:hypothetical protein